MKPKTIWLCLLGISILWLFRIFIAGTDKLGFIVFNALLAAIPILIEPLFTKIRKRLIGSIKKIALGLLSVIWLLFLPNAFYILTDLMHLNPDVLVNRRNESFYYAVSYQRGEAIYVYDSLLLTAATVFGAFVGGLALTHAYIYIRSRLSKTATYSLMTFIMLLSAVGVYIGRFSRWNSWEGLLYPWRIVSDLFDSLSSQTYQHRFLTMIFTIFIFEALSLVLVNRYLQATRHS